MSYSGKDVILAHRLLKNGMPPKVDYLLFTAPALHHMGVDAAQAGLTSHTERYDHFGEVECFVGEPAAA